MNETLKTIRSRRCIRAYKAEQIREEELQSIIEAGLYAPSAINQQSWHFTVIQNKEMLNKMVQGVKEVFKQSPNPRFQQAAADEKFNPLYGAPTLILVSGDEKAIAPQADCAAAMENMMLSAESLGVGSCWVNMIVNLFSGENANMWKKELGIPQGYKPLYSVTLGYKAVENPDAAERKENTVNYIR